MSEKKLINGYTKIDNHLLNLLSGEFSGNETKVLLYIIIKTLSFHKNSDYISISQIINHTNLSKPTIFLTLENLINKDFITIEKSTKNNLKLASKITINLLKICPYSSIKENFIGQKILPLSGQKILPTKENNYKQKEKTSSKEEVKKKAFFDDEQLVNETRDFFASLSNDDIKQNEN